MGRPTGRHPEGVSNKELTPSQSRFCELMIAGHGSCTSYALAYEIEVTEATKSSLGQRGGRLLNNPKVIAHMDKIRAPMLIRMGMTLESHLDTLEMIRDKAIAAENFGAACSAEIARGKAGGLYIERSESTIRSLSANITVPLDQLKDVAAALLTKI